MARQVVMKYIKITMMCIGNRVNLHLFSTILTMFFWDEEIMILSNNFRSVGFKLPFTGALATWGHVAVLRSSTPEIYSLLIYLYSGVAQSMVCAIPPAMNLFSLILCSLWWVQIVGYVLACRSYSFVCTLLHLIIIIVQTLSGDTELIKCLSDIVCRVCE